MIELNLMHVIVLASAAVSALWAVLKYQGSRGQAFFVEQFKAHERVEFEFHSNLGHRLDAIEVLHREDTVQWQRVERELLTLKADLPLHYVRREDYIRGQSLLEAKLDGLSVKMDFAQLRAVQFAADRRARVPDERAAGADVDVDVDAGFTKE